MILEDYLGWLLNFASIYLLIGFVFAIPFFWKGIGLVDEGTKDTSNMFKLLILPGLLVFWPLFLFKWIKGIRI